MAIYSTNQVHQLYVANAYSTTVTDASNVGTLGAVKCIAAGMDKEIYFKYKGADTVLLSDRIQLKNLNYGKAFKASDMVEPLKSVLVALDSNVNSGNLIAGQDYILGITFKNFFGMGDDHQYYKDAAVHATSGMTKAAFYAAMVNELNLAFSREVGATATSNPYLSFTSSASGITITEKPQEWTLGIQQQERVYFEVQPTTVYNGTDDLIWGTVTDQTPAKSAAVVGTTGLGNGKRIADMEWFCMGERGDQYRMKGWPNYIPTTYLVDPSKEYDVLELHYAFTDDGVSSYRSEKDITIVAPVGTEEGHEHDIINGIIGAINTAVGSTVITPLS